MMESIPVEMRRKIMEHLSDADLKRISRINKLLNFEARSLMKDRNSFVARVRSRHPPRDAASFVSDLDTMMVVPFSGINIQLHSHCGMDRNGKMHHDDDTCLQSAGELDSSIELNLGRISWSHLSVIFTGCHVTQNSLSFLLVQTILEKFCASLEEFSLTNHMNLLQPIQQVVQECRFPRLKILKLEGSDWESYTRCNPEPFIKAMAGLAPNLQEVQIEQPRHYSEDLLQGSSAVLVASCVFNPITHTMSVAVARTVRLKRMQLSYRSDRMGIPFSVRRFNTTIPMILETSSGTLNCLRMDLVLAVPLFCLGIPLSNVTHMEILVDYGYLEQLIQCQQFFTILKRFDFTRIFPSLRQVHISTYSSDITPDQINECMEHGNAVLKEAQPDRALNIKHLSFHDYLKDEVAPVFAAMCPNIERVTNFTRKGPQDRYQIVWVWEHWRDLKELVIEKDGADEHATGDE